MELKVIDKPKAMVALADRFYRSGREKQDRMIREMMAWGREDRQWRQHVAALLGITYSQISYRLKQMG